MPSPIPQPPSRWVTRLLVPSAILVTLALLLSAGLWSSLSGAVEVTATPVVEKPAIAAATKPSQTGGAVVQAAGWIEPDPFPVAVAALAEGTVRDVLFQEDSTVKAGDVLVRLVEDDARLTLRRAEAELAAATTLWDSNIELTQAAAVADAIVQETSATLAMARAELAATNALRIKAERAITRQRLLRTTASVSEAEHDAAEAESLLQTARAEGGNARIAELTASLARTEAEARAARERLALRTEDRLRLEVARIAAEEARLRLDRMEIRAPQAGVILRRLVEPGSRLMLNGDAPAAAQVAQLYDPARLQVRVDVPLADASRIGRGQTAEVEVEAVPGKRFRAVVSRITNMADIQKNTLQVKVSIYDPSPELKPEMLARVRFLDNSSADVRSGALSVFAPREVVEAGGAWVISGFDGEFGIAERRAVTLTAAASGEWSEIADGLRPGDLLITGGGESLTPGARVRIRREGVHHELR